MDKQGKPMSKIGFTLVTILAAVVVMIGGAYSLGDGLPARALVVVLGAFGMAVVWATLAVADARTSRIMPLLAEDLDTVPGLELTFTAPVPATPCTVWVMGAVGECPRGLKVGDSLVIEADGCLSRPLCKSATEALAPYLKNTSEVQGFAPEVRCACPLAPRALNFSPRPTARVALN